MEADVLAQYVDLTATIAFIGNLVNQNRRMGRQLTKLTPKYEELFERVLKAVE